MQEKNHHLIKLEETPNFDYLDTLGDESLKWNMVEIAKNEISAYIEISVKLLEENDSKQLFQVIHKLSTKFSIFGLKQTYSFIKKIEEDLKEDKVNMQDHSRLKHASEQLLSDLKVMESNR